MVLALQREAAIALRRDADQRDPFIEPPKTNSPLPTETPASSSSSSCESHGIGVLPIGEAALRLGMSRAQLETMIDRGAVEALPTGWFAFA